MDRDEAIAHVLHLRGVEAACPKCHGLGTRVYASGSTWRGGMGTAAMTYDVCDACWGSGDAHRHGADLRELAAERRAWDREQAQAYLASALGIGFGQVAARLRDLAEMADKESRRRKVPDGEREFWWRRSWEQVADCLRGLVGDERKYR